MQEQILGLQELPEGGETVGAASPQFLGQTSDISIFSDCTSRGINPITIW